MPPCDSIARRRVGLLVIALAMAWELSQQLIRRFPVLTPPMLRAFRRVEA
jgi:hypothetical protein